MIQWQQGKQEFTETEAAHALEISVEHLRMLVKQHVMYGETDGDGSVPTYRQTDLVLLRILAQQTIAHEPAL